MSKNASSADNPQEMFEHNFYFSGLLAAEMSCSIIKATNKNPKGFYYAIDLTVTNADKNLLQKINHEVIKNHGIITSVKGAYNLSARGKEKVKIALNFLKKYPILVGDLAKNRISILETALEYLSTHKGHSFQKEKTRIMDALRKKLRDIKERRIVDQKFDPINLSEKSLGNFFAGVVDGEGSFGIKSSGLYTQPFFAIAMKDKKIIESLRNFVDYGNVRLRKDGVYHLEINNRNILKNICDMFFNQYPLRHKKQKNRLKLVKQLLNDYTPKSLNVKFREHDIV